MRSARSILSVRFTAIGGPTSVRRAVGGFLRYIQQRDHHSDLEKAGGVEGFLRYATHRDHTKPEGRLFGRNGDAGDRERRELGRFVTRSVQGRTKGRAYYRFVISPEDARGLDLRRVTRKVMAQLELDAGADGLPPWVAAEHRNTVHPHVHVVMAANRRLPDGRHRTLIIHRERLARMKIAMSREIYRERGWERDRDERVLTAGHERRPGPGHQHPRSGFAESLGVGLRILGHRMSAQYKRQLEEELDRVKQREAERSRGYGLER